MCIGGHDTKDTKKINKIDNVGNNKKSLKKKKLVNMTRIINGRHLKSYDNERCGIEMLWAFKLKLKQ